MNHKSYDRPMTHQEYIQLKYMSSGDYETKTIKKKKKPTNIKSST